MNGTGNHNNPSAINVKVSIVLVDVLRIRELAIIIATIDPTADKSLRL